MLSNRLESITTFNFILQKRHLSIKQFYGFMQVNLDKVTFNTLPLPFVLPFTVHMNNSAAEFQQCNFLKAIIYWQFKLSRFRSVIYFLNILYSVNADAMKSNISLVHIEISFNTAIILLYFNPVSVATFKMVLYVHLNKASFN